MIYDTRERESTNKWCSEWVGKILKQVNAYKNEM